MRIWCADCGREKDASLGDGYQRCGGCHSTAITTSPPTREELAQLDDEELQHRVFNPKYDPYSDAANILAERNGHGMGPASMETVAHMTGGIVR